MAFCLRSPWLLGLLMFWIYPTLASAFYSFTKFNAVQAPKWIGLTNYIKLFTKDRISGMPYTIRSTSP